jgi:tRNA(Arg) A34 adenosine deaminase TadA
MDTKINLMDRACKLAVESVQKGCGPFGAIITDLSDNIIAEGHNMVTYLNDPTAHAEIMTIRSACQKLNTYDLSNYVLFSSCEPCPMCLSAIYWSRIKAVYYSNTRTDAKNIGFDDEFIYDELKKDIDERIIKLSKLDCENASSGFELWSNLLDKKSY